MSPPALRVWWPQSLAATLSADLALGPQLGEPMNMFGHRVLHPTGDQDMVVLSASPSSNSSATPSGTIDDTAAIFLGELHHYDTNFIGRHGFANLKSGFHIPLVLWHPIPSAAFPTPAPGFPSANYDVILCDSDAMRHTLARLFPPRPSPLCSTVQGAAIAAFRVAGIALVCMSQITTHHFSWLDPWPRLRPLAISHLEHLATASPLGVKLHPPLSVLLAQAGSLYVQAWTVAFPLSSGAFVRVCLAGLGATALLGNPRVLVLALCLCLRLLAAPLELCARSLGVVARSQMRAIQRLWRVLRGRQPLPSVSAFAAAKVGAEIGSGDEKREGAVEADRSSTHARRKTAPPLFRLQIRQESKPSPLLPAQGGGVREVTSSVLLLLPLALLLPTIGAFWLSAQLPCWAHLAALRTLRRAAAGWGRGPAAGRKLRTCRVRRRVAGHEGEESLHVRAWTCGKR